MELSEAKKECKDLIEEYLSCSVIGLDMQVDVGFGEKRCEAIDTILKALDNSISKDKVRKKIEECVKRRQELANGHFWESPSNINEDTAIVMAQTLYQELLGE